MTDLRGALEGADLQVVGQLADASNLALLCQVPTADGLRRCIYKPVAGERPLWDFPGAALAAREVLTAQLAAALGWDLLPTTVWRADGPHGPGMCQEWVEAVEPWPVGLFTEDALPPAWRAVAEGRTADGSLVVLAHEDSADLQRLAVLDAIVNNADRKGGHVLRDAAGRLRGIDHGVTFHAEPKLRTVLWGWAGDPLPEAVLAEVGAGREAALAVVADGLEEEWVTEAEAVATAGRVDELVRAGRFPMPGADWPSLPWPPM